MYIIEARNQKQRIWISGIFLQQSSAEAYFQSISLPQRKIQKIIELPISSYPLFIIECNGFEYGDLNLIRSRLHTLAPYGDPGYIHLNIYAVLHDFAPHIPGNDRMGELQHWHITDAYLIAPTLSEFVQELEEFVQSR